MIELAGRKVVPTYDLEKLVEDWSDVRSPGRARRRRHKHRQRIKVTRVIDPNFYEVEGVIYTHPNNLTTLRDRLQRAAEEREAARRAGVDPVTADKVRKAWKAYEASAWSDLLRYRTVRVVEDMGPPPVVSDKGPSPENPTFETFVIDLQDAGDRWLAMWRGLMIAARWK